MEINQQLEQQIEELEQDVSNEGAALRELKQSNDQLSGLFNLVKDLGEKLKNESQYKRYGYITKQDLIEIFKKRNEAKLEE